MNDKIVAMIKEKVKKATEYRDNHQPIQVAKNDGNLTIKEAWNEYASLINSHSEFQCIMSDLRYIVYVLTDALSVTSQNTAIGQKVYNQLKGQISTLNKLIDSMMAIDTEFYWALRYYEKGGGTI